MATLSAQSLSSPELGPKCANLHLVLISFWALTTGSIFWNQTLEIQQRLQILGFGGLFALKVLQMPGFGGLLALKVLQIPGFGPPCTESAANSRIRGTPCTESAANSRIWGTPCTEKCCEFQDLGGLTALKVLQIPRPGGLIL